MSLAAGIHIGPYEVVSLVGAGGTNGGWCQQL